MPKLKPNKSLTRRIKVTGTGRLMRFKAGRRHLLTGKPSRKTRSLRRMTDVKAVHKTALRQLLAS